jgi:hypothetical protein
MEAMDLEANPEEIQSKAEHKEVPKEAAVKNVRALKKRDRDRYLTVEGHQQLQWWVPNKTGRYPQSNGLLCREKVVRHKGRSHTGMKANRDDRRIGPGTRWQEKPLKDGCLRGDNGHARKAVREQRTEA